MCSQLFGAPNHALHAGTCIKWSWCLGTTAGQGRGGCTPQRGTVLEYTMILYGPVPFKKPFSIFLFICLYRFILSYAQNSYLGMPSPRITVHLQTTKISSLGEKGCFWERTLWHCVPVLLRLQPYIFRSFPNWIWQSYLPSPAGAREGPGKPSYSTNFNCLFCLRRLFDLVSQQITNNAVLSRVLAFQRLLKTMCLIKGVTDCTSRVPLSSVGYPPL